MPTDTIEVDGADEVIVETPRFSSPHMPVMPGLEVTTAAVANTHLGRYELLARLATGGMGEIFLARLEGAAGFEKLYVVKRILPHLADDVRFRQMLIAEARIASKLNHANICQVYELGETDGQLYIAMEYLEGVTLLPVLRRASRETTPLDLGLVAAVLQQTTDALHYAHELRDRDGSSLGIIHRDVTPSNLFVTDSGVVKVLDFGIAKAKGASASHTQTGAVKGKYAYMAPEQLRGGELDRRVDVFALGISLFEMLALRRLFQRKTDYLTFRAVMEQPIPDVRQYRADTPDALAEVVARALDRDPARRFDTARQLGTAALDAIATAGRRPWSQGELGDYVRSTFADELGKRSEEVASATHRTEPGSPRALGQTGELQPLVDEAPGGDDDTEFLPVETAAEVFPAGLRPTPPTPLPRVDTTPMPFGIDSTTSGESLQPVVTTPPPPAPRRSLVWPILATGMFLVAGGALVLVWQVMSKQAPPTSVVISTSDKPRVEQDRVVVGPSAQPDPPGSAGSAGPTPTPPPAGSAAPAWKQHILPTRNPYDRAIDARKDQLSRCAKDHPDPTPPTAAVLHIDLAGHPTTVTLQPAAANATPLGDCLKAILHTAKFPTATTEVDLTFPFHVKPT
jgi:serine/threonine-protein kinase